jgi:hypothetical protein
LTSLQLIVDVVKAAFDRHGSPTKRRRRGTDEDHVDRAEAAKTYLASRLRDRITLDDVSRAVQSHFTDVFRREFGRPPSAVRRNAGRRALRELSKNLEV